ncbi:MAG: 3-deoxy-manno-octulosonate cytidylyltransferase [Bacteroidales bacterium]
MNIIGIIPARYASTRFPGKPLAMIAGVSMIQRVYQRCKLSELLSDIIVATDDLRILHHVENFGGKAVMTDECHNSGTERCSEVVKILYQESLPDVIINIQGDEPFIHPEQIESVVNCFTNSDISIATLGKVIVDQSELFNPNVVKLLPGLNNKAIYFSRSAIPFLRGVPENQWLQKYPYLKHIGIYAYKTKVLTEIVALPPSALEQAESLEQLRWIENGYSIGFSITGHESKAIDTPDDLSNLTFTDL